MSSQTPCGTPPTPAIPTPRSSQRARITARLELYAIIEKMEAINKNSHDLELELSSAAPPVFKNFWHYRDAFVSHRQFAADFQDCLEGIKLMEESGSLGGFKVQEELKHCGIDVEAQMECLAKISEFLHPSGNLPDSTENLDEAEKLDENLDEAPQEPKPSENSPVSPKTLEEVLKSVQNDIDDIKTGLRRFSEERKEDMKKVMELLETLIKKHQDDVRIVSAEFRDTKSERRSVTFL
ncbi:hypothetical protein B9Z55_026558 [Caenorhabditis nigoni]|uniref:Uncharacterized protein n=1 Tax=Caenorhabditis nigoni TaxID=1611254 RepID=A0A2G5T3N2_9PELO|nr:hypothetical protein B9Z55_026558 [Caenorhabditis nigoni]